MTHNSTSYFRFLFLKWQVSKIRRYQDVKSHKSVEKDKTVVKRRQRTLTNTIHGE
jgi:hypothetical protein